MGKPVRDLTGQKFGRWTAIKRVDKPEGTKDTGAYWLFRCECGTERVKRGAGVVNKGGSCGCLRSEVNSIQMAKMQLNRHGTIKDRFFSRFKKVDNGCWIWTAHADKDGYGILSGNKSNTRANRLSYEIHHGPIKEGFVVCHTCDTPSCVNPDHLFQGTVKDNCRDMISKNRDKIVGSRNNKAKLVEKDIPTIRSCSNHNSVIAIDYGVCEATIKRIKARTLWRHVK